MIVPSGFKVTILAGLVATSTSWMYRRRDKELKPLLPAQKREGYWRQWLVTSIVIMCIIAYSVLSGAGPAAQRACIMGIILAIAPRFRRVYNVYTALALAALIMCIFDPLVLWNTGFQLSTIGTLGIVMLTPFIQRLFRPIDRLPFAYIITEVVAITLAAEIATLPIFAFTFNQIPLIAVLANTLTVPLLSTLIMLGLLICVSGVFFLPLGILCGWIIWPLLWYTNFVIKWCASIPWAFLTVGDLDPRMSWCYYGVLILILSIILRKWPEKSQLHEVNINSSLLPPKILPVLQYAVVIIVILVAGANVVAVPANANEQLSITLLNVGPAGKPSQGEAILIHTIDGKSILIDGGLDATSLAQELDSRLPFWQRSIDTVILISPRQDHLIGAYVRYN